MSILKYEHENNTKEAVNSIMGSLLRVVQTLDLAFLGILGIKTTLISDFGLGIRQIIQTVPSMVSLYHVL